MYRGIVIVRECLHVIEYDPVHDKNRKCNDKFPGWPGNKIQCAKQYDQENLLWLKSNQ